MNEDRVRAELTAVETPDADAAEHRAWSVVRSAYLAREPVPPRRRRTRAVIALATVGAVVVGLASPPGRAFVDRVRKAVGVERAAPALFELPAPGRLLVASDDGVWVASEDGSKRRIGAYREAAWSPYGKFVAAARRNELSALEADGTVRWTLARRDVRSPRWGGTRTDTRIAYFSEGRLRVVAGDGTADTTTGPSTATQVPPAWKPDSIFELAYAPSPRRVAVLSKLGWERIAPVGGIRKLEWSTDGRRLLVVGRVGVRVYDERGRVVGRDDPSDATRDLDATFLRGSHRVVAIRFAGGTSTLFDVNGNGRPRFVAAGRLTQVVGAPDGSGVMLAWPTADQFVFVRLRGTRAVRAIANVSAQFRSRTFPRVEGWISSADARTG